ncbi:hypothetical protein PHSY_001339 [Pseudozyma hubeiensis SY62]|uniref:Uncharacterized protein n=1 Tax=Pseudozyma hubeiensis (strain SY62) TaxID=1305764 RepID=R9NYJ1_PSEHS|nr:hypothetical protein PHSY_001339 [Pseudozyma hubeiensis SY62]GAC93774.1 hypothetical protein PHSY_001339 [Pseudozyma hubeiensis SY62]
MECAPEEPGKMTAEKALELNEVAAICGPPRQQVCKGKEQLTVSQEEEVKAPRLAAGTARHMIKLPYLARVGGKGLSRRALFWTARQPPYAHQTGVAGALRNVGHRLSTFLGRRLYRKCIVQRSKETT